MLKMHPRLCSAAICVFIRLRNNATLKRKLHVWEMKVNMHPQDGIGQLHLELDGRSEKHCIHPNYSQSQAPSAPCHLDSYTKSAPRTLS